MYRAPEMLDQWQGFNVDGFLGDVWALGCVLYVLCTGSKHPFQDAQNLAILNASYTMEGTERVGEPLQDLIYAILVTNPAHRLTLTQLIDILERLKNGENVQVPLC